MSSLFNRSIYEDVHGVPMTQSLRSFAFSCIAPITGTNVAAMSIAASSTVAAIPNLFGFVVPFMLFSSILVYVLSPWRHDQSITIRHGGCALFRVPDRYHVLELFGIVREHTKCPVSDRTIYHVSFDVTGMAFVIRPTAFYLPW